MSTTLTLGIGASERIDFPATQTGRYILVVIKTSKNLANGGGTEADNIYGSLAEFDLYQKTGGVTPDVNVKLGRSGWTVEASSVSQDGARNPRVPSMTIPALSGAAHGRAPQTASPDVPHRSRIKSSRIRIHLHAASGWQCRRPSEIMDGLRNKHPCTRDRIGGHRRIQHQRQCGCLLMTIAISLQPVPENLSICLLATKPK